jgi:hypothetical protein
MTMGIVAVASLAERKSSTPVNDNVYFETHQLSREHGKAIDFSLMTSPFNDNVFPSTYPSSRRPWRNACVRAETEVELDILSGGFSSAAAPKLEGKRPCGVVCNMWERRVGHLRWT